MEKNKLFLILALILIISLAGCIGGSGLLVNSSNNALPQNHLSTSTTISQKASNNSEKVENSSIKNTATLINNSSNQNQSFINMTINVTQQTINNSIQPLQEAKIINGKTLDQRLEETLVNLHTQGSGAQLRSNFPDIELVYTDHADNTGFPNSILPFKYYYSQEANKTFSICNIDFTVFICNGKLENLVTNQDIISGRCNVTSIYLIDPRLGRS